MLLLQARETVMRLFRPPLKRHGLTEQQWRVLRALDDRDDLEIGRIAEVCSILGPSLTGVLDRMERDGLVVRSRSDTDQRRVSVRLTQASRNLIEALSTEVEAHYAHIEHALGRDALAQLYTLLDAVTALPRPDAPAMRLRRPPDAVADPRKPIRPVRKRSPRSA